MSNTSKFGAAIKGLIGGLGTLAAGAAFAFHQFEESEKLVSQTNAVLQSTGGVANVTAKDVTNLATALMHKAAVDDEVVRNGENVLLTFTNIRNEVGKGNDIFDRATRLTLDLSVAMGQDMKSSAIQVGKALNDPIAGLTSLSRIGVKFTEETKEQITALVEHGKTLEAQKLILSELSTEFKGSAEAQKTASAEIGVALGELAEKIGKLLAPAIEFLAEKLTTLVEFIQKNAGPAFREIIEAIQQAADWFKNLWQQVQPVAETVINVLTPAFQAAWHAIRDRLVPALERLWESFGPILKVLALAAVAFGTVVVGQVLLLITAISHLIDWFSKLVDWVRENLAEPIVGAVQKVIDWLTRLADWVKDRFLGAWQAVKGPVLAIIGSFVEAIKTLIGWIQDAIHFVGQLGQGVAQAVAEKGANAGVFRGVHVPGAATGGFVQRSGLAVIHKGENIVPAGGGGVTVNVNGWVGSDTQLARKIRDELNKLSDRNAGSGVR